jgi:hypothetical protein
MTKASNEKDVFIIEMIHNHSISVDPLTGDVYSHWTAKRSSNVTLLSGRIASHGYVQYNLSRNGHQSRLYGHRIVWIASNGLIPDDLEIDHINRVKHDNRLCNLRLVTNTENMQNCDLLKGEHHLSAKLTANDVVEIRNRYHKGGCYSNDLAREYNVNPSTIEKIVNGKTWKSLPILPKSRASKWSKLTKEQASEIRSMKDVKLSIIAQKYNISRAYACQIRKGVYL